MPMRKFVLASLGLLVFTLVFLNAADSVFATYCNPGREYGPFKFSAGGVDHSDSFGLDPIYGVRGIMEGYDPWVGTQHVEFSTTWIMLTKEGDQVNHLQAGWMKTNDTAQVPNNPKFFVEWTYAGIPHRYISPWIIWPTPDQQYLTISIDDIDNFDQVYEIHLGGPSIVYTAGI